ncbi:MAG TPA: DUF1566 domain-containing protein [Casimicrobium sp.]|nr:DUF1566 domain-containing protein [Casimicrobium sp.]
MSVAGRTIFGKGAKWQLALSRRGAAWLRPTNAVLAALCALGANAAPINDAGLTLCRNHTTGVDETCNLAIHGAQDATVGRDRAAATVGSGLTKVGAGAAGFDFTKISNAGNAVAEATALGSAANDWACTRDNVTGLTWDVPLASSAGNVLRKSSWTYTWFDSNAATNGGSAGVDSGGSCQVGGRCDTEKFVADVNALSPPLCGYSDWRMPSSDELIGIMHYGAAGPLIDATYFPNTSGNAYWSGTANAGSVNWAWNVSFSDGSAGGVNKNTGYGVRLVRGN